MCPQKVFAVPGLNCADTATTTIPQTDCNALESLYTSTNGASWSMTWSGATPCTYYGVTCSGGRVTMLDFFANQLSGTIPKEIGNLTKLTTLELEFNPQLTGSIPSEIGNLSELTSLSFFYNQLSGSIPAELGMLSMLVNLNLSINQLTGSIPPEIGNLSSIVNINLSQNMLW